MKGHADKTSDWREHYGFLDATDKLFLAYPSPAKARSPNESDKAVDWAIAMRPQTASDFLNNESAVEQLTRLSQPVSPKARGQNIIILGPPGVGKTSYMQLLLAHLYPVPAERKRFTLSLDADQIDERDLLVKVQTFTRYHEKHTVLVDKYLYIAVDNFDRLNPRVQQHTLGPIWEMINSKSIYFILTVTPDASRVTEQIRLSSTCIPLVPLTPLHVLEKVLRICTHERIGYVRSAIEALVARKKAKCIPTVQLLQKLFLTHHYLSAENVRKSLPAKTSSEPNNRVLSIPEVTFPLRRCTVCTLLPPCKHIPLDKMYAKVTHMRSLYPQDNQRVVCPDFARTGVCHAFHRRAKCLYDHPLELHEIDTSPLAPRCKVHTLPLPRAHCATLTRSVAEAKALKAQLKTAEGKRAKATKELGVVQHRLYLHLKTEATLWGNAKQQFDGTTAHLRGLVSAATANVAQWKDVIRDTTPKVAALDAAIARGFCKGVGKGQAYPLMLAEKAAQAQDTCHKDQLKK